MRWISDRQPHSCPSLMQPANLLDSIGFLAYWRATWAPTVQIKTLAHNSNCIYQVKSCAKTILRVTAVCQNATTLHATTVIHSHEHGQLHHLKILEVFAELQWMLAIYAGVMGSKLRVANTHPHSDRYSTVCLHYASSCVILAELLSARSSADSPASYWQSSKRTSRWGCLHLLFCSLCQPFYHPPLTQILPSVWCLLSTESI